MGEIMAKRVTYDCRKYPSDKNCSLTISGTEAEVSKVAVRHAIEDHGHKKSEAPALKKWFKKNLKN